MPKKKKEEKKFEVPLCANCGKSFKFGIPQEQKCRCIMWDIAKAKGVK